MNNKEILVFADIDIDKLKFHHHKNPIMIDDVDVDDILISNKAKLAKKVANTLLVKTMMIIKLNHCV